MNLKQLTIKFPLNTLKYIDNLMITYILATTH